MSTAKAPVSFLPKKTDRQLLLWHFENDDFQGAYPALYQLLALAQDGQAPRDGATLTLFAGDGRLKAALTDKHTAQTLWMTLEGSRAVLDEIDRIIQSGRGEWRPMKAGWVKR
jgi:hypothetical protein